MRLIGLLLALLAVGWLVMTQLKSTPTTAVSAEDSTGSAVKAPRNAEELKAVEDQVKRMSDQQNAKAREALEQIQ